MSRRVLAGRIGLGGGGELRGNGMAVTAGIRAAVAGLCPDRGPRGLGRPPVGRDRDRVGGASRRRGDRGRHATALGRQRVRGGGVARRFLTHLPARRCPARATPAARSSSRSTPVSSCCRRSSSAPWCAAWLAVDQVRRRSSSPGMSGTGAILDYRPASRQTGASWPRRRGILDHWPAGRPDAHRSRPGEAVRSRCNWIGSRLAASVPPS